MDEKKFYLDDSNIFITGGLLGNYDQTRTDLEGNSSNPTLAIVTGSWLYTITDRILSRTNLTLIQLFIQPDGFLTANSEIDYFIENRFSLFSNILMVHHPKFLDKDQNRRNIQFIFSAGLRYYLKRELF